ncbi:fibronectin type III domain-containing protein [Paenibacillus sp. RRE4]|uniref:fibronectin type III domain-containing protein n=1 Tax=Paenibacillus sp. RRE4 TaxID=2962587 RepID=UPI002882C938|nr:fibronectin type III domain-containing protein [Paenibacillus sp. RRE4]MDT0123126.1 fibronectin type III domain-containing protein [Paenibacillus sp. RRE4]
MLIQTCPKLRTRTCTDYRVSVEGQEHVNGTLVGSSSSSDYTDKGLLAGTTYTYTVRAYDAKGNLSSASSSLQSSTLSSTSSQIPLLSSDIGSVGVAGSFSYSGGTYTLKASGNDVWNKTDEFRFAYVPLKGDGSIIARVVSLTNTYSSAKAGVMVRESLLGFGSNVYVALKPSQAVFQNRTAPGAATNSNTASTQAAPYWVKAVRKGNTVTGYISTDGSTWTQAGSSTISSASTAYIGLAATCRTGNKRYS